MKNNVVVLLIFGLCLSHFAKAQNDKHYRRSSAEINPLAYAFQGWSIGGSVTHQPVKLKKWVFNEGAYEFQIPKVFVEQIPGNEGEGFELKIRSAFTSGVDFHPWNSDRSGIAFGSTNLLGNFEVTNENEPGKVEYRSFYLVPRTSYAWFLFKGLYVMRWVGVEIHNKLSESTQVGSLDFKPMDIQFSPNISNGYALLINTNLKSKLI